MKLYDQDNELLNILNTSGRQGLIDWAVKNNRLIAKQDSSRTKSGLMRVVKMIQEEYTPFAKDKAYTRAQILNSKYTHLELEGYNYWILNKIQANKGLNLVNSTGLEIEGVTVG